MTDRIAFEVRGIPIQEGSARAFVVGGKGGKKPRAVVTHDSRRDLGGWRRLVRDRAQGAAPPAPWEGPIGVSLRFGLPKPKSVRDWAGRGKNRVPVRNWPATRPDLDKLARAAIDSLSGVVFGDDKQVVLLLASKDYGVPGVRIEVWRVTHTEVPSTTVWLARGGFPGPPEG